MTTQETQSACRYDLSELPDGIAPMTEDNSKNKAVLKWSGCFPIPQIGDRVVVNMNQLGAGVIESYFVEHGYFGVCVRLDKPPKWKRKQHKGTKHEFTAMVFGREIKLKGAAK